MNLYIQISSKKFSQKNSKKLVKSIYTTKKKRKSSPIGLLKKITNDMMKKKMMMMIINPIVRNQQIMSFEFVFPLKWDWFSAIWRDCFGDVGFFFPCKKRFEVLLFWVWRHRFCYLWLFFFCQKKRFCCDFCEWEKEREESFFFVVVDCVFWRDFVCCHVFLLRNRFCFVCVCVCVCVWFLRESWLVFFVFRENRILGCGFYWRHLCVCFLRETDFGSFVCVCVCLLCFLNWFLVVFVSVFLKSWNRFGWRFSVVFWEKQILGCCFWKDFVVGLCCFGVVGLSCARIVEQLAPLHTPIRQKNKKEEE